MAALFAKLPVGLGTTVVNGPIVAAVLWSGGHRLRIVAWCAALLLISAARLALWRGYRRRGGGTPARWAGRFTAGAAAGGAAWGAAPLLLFAQSGPDRRLFLAFVIGGMVAGATGSMSTHLPAFAVFAVAALAPLAALLFSGGEPVQLAMGFMVVVFGFAMASIARASGRAFAEALALRLRNEGLVEVLSAARERLAAMNATLEERVAERTAALARGRALLEQAGVAVVVAELPELRVVDVNEGACQLFGRLREEIAGTVLDELPFRGGPTSFGALADGLGPSDVRTLEWEVPGSGTTPRVFELGVAARTFESREFLLVVGRDVTERKALEREVARAGLLASLGSVAAGVCHEINGPLSYVLGSLRFLEEQPESARGDPALAEAIHEALHGAERVRDIVRRLGALSPTSVERGAAEPVVVEEVLESCIRLSESEVLARARLVREYRRPVPPVRADRGRLTQVFRNLLSNAAQAIPLGQAEANEIRVGVRYDARTSAVVVEVTDTGQGIPRAHLDRVFEPFFTTRAVGEGSGLGLSVCHGIVASMGGRIAASSTEGRGATFTVELPAGADPPPALARAGVDGQQAASPPPGRARILVVDDDPHVARAIARALRSANVSTAGSGEEALGLLGAEPFDLVLCDMMMPGMSGMELYERVRAARPGLERRIVFITGGVFTPEAADFLARVTNARLEKPFDVAALQGMVRELIAGERREGGGPGGSA